jgi:hypothetical protein
MIGEVMVCSIGYERVGDCIREERRSEKGEGEWERSRNRVIGV